MRVQGVRVRVAAGIMLETLLEAGGPQASEGSGGEGSGDEGEGCSGHYTADPPRHSRAQVSEGSGSEGSGGEGEGGSGHYTGDPHRHCRASDDGMLRVFQCQHAQ